MKQLESAPMIAQAASQVCSACSGKSVCSDSSVLHTQLVLPATEPCGVETAAAMTASVAPIDMPTSAAARAARSLIPSPQNIVVFPRPCMSNAILVD